MASQQIAYPDTAAAVVADAAHLGSPEEPTSAGTTDTNASSNADYFEGHLSGSQAAEVPKVSDRAAPGMGFAPGQQPNAHGGAQPSSSDKYGDMGKMVMGLVGTVAASQMSHGGGGHYGHHQKKHGKGALLASGAKMAYDMYNKKAGKPGAMPGQPGAMPGQPGMQVPQGNMAYGAPPHQQQQQYGMPQNNQPQGYYGVGPSYGAQPGMPPHGH